MQNTIIRLLTIITGLQNFLTNNIKSFTDFIINHHKYINIGLPSEKDGTLLRKKRKNTEVVFKGDNLTEEIKKFISKDGISPSMIIDEKDEVKSKCSL
jgi:hypothetical protein